MSEKDKVEGILEERGQLYGDAALTHARIAEVWSGILNTEVTGRQVALCMVGLKLVRADCGPEHKDSYDDAHGYLTIAESIVFEEPLKHEAKEKKHPILESTVGVCKCKVLDSIHTGTDGRVYAQGCPQHDPRERQAWLEAGLQVDP